jgi:chromosome partitioning protein
LLGLDAGESVQKEFGLPLMRTALHHRTVYRQSAVFGGIVHQLGNRAARAIGEVEALTDEVLALLGGPRSA